MEETKINKVSFNLILRIVFGVLFLIAIAGGIYFYIKYQNTKTLLDNPDVATKLETESVVSKVKKLMVLPEDEEPTLATVLDSTKLLDQPFFAKAKNGDQVLIYGKSQIAILFRPDANIIVNVAPITLGTNPSVNQVKVSILNGTSTTGLTQKAESEISSKINNISVVKKANASRNDYVNTIVVDLTGNNSTMVQNIASALGGTVSALPQGENAPSGSDVLIIVGADFVSK